jgi:hypothetical protein
MNAHEGNTHGRHGRRLKEQTFPPATMGVFVDEFGSKKEIPPRVKI